jgi:hypothetical protein
MRRRGWEVWASWVRFRIARMALWEAPTMATEIGRSVGRVVARSLGLRTRSRSRRWMFSPETGMGAVVGKEPVQRIRRVASMVSRSSDEFCLMEMVHLEV